MIGELLGSSAFGAALIFGFRHGFDWDHLAALSDLTGSQQSARRSMGLASLYALGHATMVLVLGAAAILFAEEVPGSVDAVMKRVVGVSLIALGGWVVWTAVRTRGAPPMRSRWMLLIGAVQGLAGRRRSEPTVVVVEHSHPHHHGGPMHQHPHLAEIPVRLEGGHPEAGREGSATEVATAHSHAHRHVAAVPVDPFRSYGAWSSFGIGTLHGIGAETPTQLLLFAAAAHAGGRVASLGLLACFVIGLLVANTVVAAAGTVGSRRLLQHRVVAVVLAAATAAFSLTVGLLLVLGRSGVLPTILGG